MICKKCSKQFPVNIKIDGKIKSLSRRSYCLDCSPLNSRTKITDTERRCAKCEKTQSITEYHSRGPNKGTRGKCKRCVKLEVNDLIRNVKQQCVDYKGGQCELCGYSTCIAAIDFHHKDPSKKDFNVSCRKSLTKKVKEELDKCQILCSNCHRELHYKQVDPQL